MAEAPFPFFRATYYRWVQRFRAICADLLGAPTVLGVGDLHVENFGTWRDGDGRLIWGINDFDEASRQPYPNDLARLAASALLAIENCELKIDPADACDAILGGYSDTLAKGGRPVVLAEHNVGLREMAKSQERDPVAFWEKLNKMPTLAEVPDFVRPLLEKWFPEPGLNYRVIHRIAGLGSLGRRRFTALADWRGGCIARETKELVVSAWGWEDPPAGEKGDSLRGHIAASGSRRRSIFSSREFVDCAPLGSLLQPHRVAAPAGDARRQKTAVRNGPRDGQYPLRRHGGARRDRPRSVPARPKMAHRRRPRHGRRRTSRLE